MTNKLLEQYNFYQVNTVKIFHKKKKSYMYNIYCMCNIPCRSHADGYDNQDEPKNGEYRP